MQLSITTSVGAAPLQCRPLSSITNTHVPQLYACVIYTLVHALFVRQLRLLQIMANTVFPTIGHEQLLHSSPIKLTDLFIPRALVKAAVQIGM